jgi:thiol-disulfide isomerase/thioredoxin
LEFPAVYFFKTRATYVDFFPLLEEHLRNPYKPLSTNNPNFNRVVEHYRTVDLLNIAMYFISTPRAAHPEKEDYPDLYRNIDMAKLTEDTFLLDYYPFGVALLSRLIMQKYIFDNVDPRNIALDDILSNIKNETMKGEFILMEAGKLKSYIGYTELMDKYGQFLLLPDQEKRASEIVVKLAKEESQPGQPAINFTGTDINGKKVSLSDLKGKVVYVDIWATWCGPCLNEIPHFQKLMEEYKGKDIVFMAISIDAAKDKPKWEQFVKEKGKQGLQLFAGNGWESDVAKMYQVIGIPRFMLFDKKGNIVSTNAPRPSSAEIKQLLNATLK